MGRRGSSQSHSLRFILDYHLDYTGKVGVPVSYIDISAPLSDDVKSYIPGVTYTRSKPIFTLDQDGVESHELVISTLSGTYFETGRHVSSDAISIDEVPIETFVGPAVILDVGQKEASEPITLKDLQPYADRIQPGDAAVVRTHWSRRWNTSDYFTKSPYFTPEAFEWLLQHQLRILAGDIPSYDDPSAPAGLIKRLFQDGKTFLLAPLVSLDQVTEERVTLYAFPLKIKGVSGAPARVLVGPLEGRS